MRPRWAAEAAVGIACLAAGVLFFVSLDDLWPLVPGDLARPRVEREAAALDVARNRGWDLSGHTVASRLQVDSRSLRWIQREFGRGRTEAWIREGLPLVEYAVAAKRRGDPTFYWVWSGTAGAVHGWHRHVERDEPGARPDADRARAIVREAIERDLGLDPGDWTERSLSVEEQPERRDHRLRLEREIAAVPGGFVERLSALVAGDELVQLRRTVVPPPSAGRDERAASGPAIALEAVGFLAVAVFVGAAFLIALVRIGRGEVPLGRTLALPGVVFVGLLVTHLLDRFALVSAWDPLIPRWIADFQTLVYLNVETVWILLLLLAVVAAGRALDAGGRGETLWRLLRGQIAHPAVARASSRGFLIGLLCGGVLAGSTLLLEWGAGAQVELQPRHFFFYTLNSVSPPLSSLCFFLGVALGEELGYRYFGFNWLWARTRSRAVAVLVPALIYGLTHTRLAFLPPEQPWWGRALVLTLVGATWGWAYLRYDALTVVLSHFTADLFIFNWPLLTSERLEVRGWAIATVALPLLPALCWAVRRGAGGQRAPAPPHAAGREDG